MTAANGHANGVHLTPAMQRCLGAYRLLGERLGRAPTAVELSHLQGGIAGESVRRLVEKLEARGYRLPLSLTRCTPKAGIIAVSIHERWESAAELEIRQVRDMLREADAILSTIQVNDRPARDAWRRKCAAYLDTVPPAPDAAVAAVVRRALENGKG